MGAGSRISEVTCFYPGNSPREAEVRPTDRHLMRAQCEPLDSTMAKLNQGNGNDKIKTKKNLEESTFLAQTDKAIIQVWTSFLVHKLLD